MSHRFNTQQQEQPIPIPNTITQYNGYEFKSRTEARWAVFFDTLSINYIYEHQDFKIQKARYLPDFWLPELCGGCFVEVKGYYFTDIEKWKCVELCRYTKRPVLMLTGIPAFAPVTACIFERGEVEQYKGVIYGSHRKGIFWEPPAYDNTVFTREYAQAVDRAKQYNFELQLNTLNDGLPF